MVSIGVVAAIADTSILRKEYVAATNSMFERIVDLRGVSSVAARISAYRGRRNAQRDIAAGDLRLKTYGLPDFKFSEEYERVIDQKYHIKTDWVAYCVVNERIAAYARAYNEVSVAAIEKRYGAGILEATEKPIRERIAAERNQYSDQSPVSSPK